VNNDELLETRRAVLQAMGVHFGVNFLIPPPNGYVSPYIGIVEHNRPIGGGFEGTVTNKRVQFSFANGVLQDKWGDTYSHFYTKDEMTCTKTMVIKQNNSWVVVQHFPTDKPPGFQRGV
jgi:hypothetical protein